MYNKCCIVGCDSRRKDVNFYRFPKTETGLTKWWQFITCERLGSVSFQELRKHFVCKKHFEKKFFASTTVRSRLRVGAYPTLFSIDEIVSGVPQQSVQSADNSINAIHTDHDYFNKRKHEDHCYFKIEEKRPRIESELVAVPSSSRLPLRSIENLDSNSLDSTSGGEKHPIEQQQIAQVSEFNMPSTSHLPSLHEIEVDNLPSTSACKNKSRKDNLGQSFKSSTKLLRRRKRVIIKKKSLSPCCEKLYKEYVSSRKQLEFSRRAKRALKFTEEKCFDKLTKNLNPLAKKILWMQIKQRTKQSKGRRYTNEEKLIALSIMKQSPKCYKFLHKIFILPSKYTLNKMVAKLNIEAGINPQVFEAVKREVVTWNENKKYCTIMFDEVALEAALIYDKHKDTINGFVELNERTNDFADHALVFLLRGAVYKWQQPIAFYFCKGATSGIQLKQILKEMISSVFSTGLIPVALVSDQGTAFQSALRSLQEDTRREQILTGDKIDDVITINGQTLSVIYDPPHLIKGLRNNFITKNIKYEGKVSKWNDIVEVYKTDCNHAQMRLLHKLNDEHVIPEKIKKMKVKNCVKVLSQTVASTLSYTAQFSHYADGNPVSPTLSNTSKMVAFFDNLFDSVNGASLYTKKNKGKPLRHAVTEKSPNHGFWKEAIEKLQKIRFIDSHGKETSVPSLKNWVVTLKSYQRLWRFFTSKNVKIMRPRYFNSDPIENFFGQVRAYNFRNNDPNCHTFKSTFRSLLITRFIQFHSESFNCEEESGEQLLKVQALFESHTDNAGTSKVGSPECSAFQSAEERTNKTAGEERLNIHSRAYTTGWVVRHILRKIKCERCEANLTTDEKNCVNSYISFREFKCLKEKKLTYPSEHAVRLFGNIILEANQFLENSPHRRGIIKELKQLIQSKHSYDSLACEQHKSVVAESFISLTLRLTVFNWCNIINKILKGTDVCRLENKILPCMQRKAFIKFKTKLRNKRHNK